MPEHRNDPEPSKINLTNILFAIFKWKRTILAFALAGIAIAAAIYFFYPASYESDARLLVRYVLERSGYDPVDAISGSSRGSGISYDGVIAAEVSILTSWDLSVQVAEALGPNRVLPDSKAPSVVAAAAAINSGLSTATAKGSNIIEVSYQNPKPEVATAVLNELVSRYFTKHLEVHRSAGAFDFVSQQSDQIRARLNQTEDALKALKAKAGVMSLQDSMASVGAQSSHLEEQIRAAENDLAEEQAKVKQIERGGLPVDLNETDNAKDNPPAPPTQASTKDIGDYQALVTNLTKLRETQLEMSAKYTPENVMIKMNQAHITDLENQKRNLEKKFPEVDSLWDLVSLCSLSSSSTTVTSAARKSSCSCVRPSCFRFLIKASIKALSVAYDCRGKMVSGPVKKRPIRASLVLLRGKSSISFVPIQRRFGIVSAYISSYMELPINQSW